MGRRGDDAALLARFCDKRSSFFGRQISDADRAARFMLDL